MQAKYTTNRKGDQSNSLCMELQARISQIATAALILAHYFRLGDHKLYAFISSTVNREQ